MVVKRKVEDHNNHIETFFDPFFAKTVPAKNLQQEMCQVPPRTVPMSMLFEPCPAVVL